MTCHCFLPEYCILMYFILTGFLCFPTSAISSNWGGGGGGAGLTTASLLLRTSTPRLTTEELDGPP